MYSVFRDLAIIILSAKFFGLVARKCKAPQVVGEIIAGLLIGPCILNLVQTSDAISTFAEIGVVMLMFTTGLGTNLKELIKAGPHRHPDRLRGRSRSAGGRHPAVQCVLRLLCRGQP